MVRVGFSKMLLIEAAEENLAHREPIEGIFLCLESEDGTYIFATLDYMDFNRKYTDTLRAKMSEHCRIPESNIHILTTHNHGGGKPRLDVLAELCAQGALKAMFCLKQAVVRYKFIMVEKQLSIIRRLYIPETEGVSTLYFGACEKNGFDSSLFREHVVEQIRNGHDCNSIGVTSSYEKLPFPYGDRELFVMEFATTDGEPIGSILRFSAHAVCANRGDSYSSDYPYYARKTMEELFGGISLFWNGPCAEIAPAMLDKYEGRERVLGEYIAKAAYNAVQDEKFSILRFLSVKKAEIKLPVREEVLKMEVDIPKSMPTSLPERKRYLEKVRLKSTLPFLDEKYREGEDAPDESVAAFVGILKLNGVTFVAFPGETFSKTAKTVKDNFPEMEMVTVTEHERTVMYLPAAEDFRLGGYEAVCKLTDENAETVLRESVIRLLENFMG